MLPDKTLLAVFVHAPKGGGATVILYNADTEKVMAAGHGRIAEEALTRAARRITRDFWPTNPRRAGGMGPSLDDVRESVTRVTGDTDTGVARVIELCPKLAGGGTP